MTHRRYRLALVMALLVAASTAAWAAGQARDNARRAEAALQAAIVKEVVAGDVAGAIADYRAIEALYEQTQRPVAARALLRMAQAYERSGRAEAVDAFEALVRTYPDQTAAVTEAQRRLASRPAQSPVGSQTGPVKARVWGHRYIAGRPSPDGRFLPWVNYGRRAQPAGLGIDLVLHDLQTGADRVVTRSTHLDSYAESATFTPDGRRLLYTWFDAAEDEWQIRLIDVDGRNDRIVRRGTVSYGGVVAPDGSSAAVAANNTSGQRIALLDFASGEMRTLRTVEWNGLDLGNFSPDGRLLVYSEVIRQGAEDRDIQIIAIDGSLNTTIASGAANRHPFFTPDGRHVVFTSNRSGQWDLWRVPVAKGAAVGPLAVADSNTGPVKPLGFTKDGMLFYQQSIDRSEALEVTIDAGTNKAVGPPRVMSTSFVGNQLAPTWSPDGSRFAMATRRYVGEETLEGPVSFVVSERGAERSVDTIDSMRFAFARTLRWFPAMTSLLIVEWQLGPGSRSFSRLELATGRRQVLFRTAFSNSLSSALSSDGESLFYVVRDETDRKLAHVVHRALTSGAERRVTTVEGNLQGLALSPDGRTLGFLLGHQRPSWCVWTAPAGGGEAREVWEAAEGQVVFGTVMGGTVWAADGRGMFVTVRDGSYDGPQSLWYVPVDGGQPHGIGVAMEQVTASSAHPDGRRLAVTGTSSRKDVWTLNNLTVD